MPLFKEADPSVVTASVGGSVFRPERINVPFVEQFISFCQEQIAKEKSVIAVVGGGGIARNDIEDARKLGVDHEPTLDQIGIAVTQNNAFLLSKFLLANGIDARLRSPGDQLLCCTIYVQGGSEPGHTTDFIAIQAAHEIGQKVILNISRVQGLHPKTPDGFDHTKIIESISLDELQKMAPGQHTPGIEIPFDPPDIALAKEYGISIILLGPDFANIRECLAGREFVGTIIHP